MQNLVPPIAEPQRIYIGQRLFTISVQRMLKKPTDSVQQVIGNEVQFASILEVEVETLHMNDGKTGVIINKEKEPIRIPFNVASLSSETDGAIFDEEKKALAVAKVINVSNRERAVAIQNEIGKSISFLEQLIKEGA